jgi:flagellar biogenesis protein FliO
MIESSTVTSTNAKLNSFQVFLCFGSAPLLVLLLLWGIIGKMGQIAPTPNFVGLAQY